MTRLVFETEGGRSRFELAATDASAPGVARALALETICNELRTAPESFWRRGTFNLVVKDDGQTLLVLSLSARERKGDRWIG